MQLFVAASRWPGLDEQRVVGALRTAARAFPELDERTLAQGSSADGRVAFAAIAHPPERVGPRRYFARSDDVAVAYDGHPVPVHDAAVLLERWGQDELEGVFSAVRVDLAAGTVDLQLDVFGMAKVFRATRGDGSVVSNSLEVVRLLTGASELDPVGVSSMLGLGWAAGGHTLLDGIEVVPGPVTPRTVTPRHATSRRSAREVADTMLEHLTAAAVVRPLSSGLTGGRDSRLILGLVRMAGLDVDYYTSGHSDDVDVVIARELARELGFHHRLVTPQVPDDWTTATSGFSAQTDGLASFWIVADWVEHQGVEGDVGLKLWGPGGEIGRSGRIGLAIPFGANTPGLRASAAVQRRILHRKVAESGGLVTREAVTTARAYLDRFVAARLDEGWRPREVSEAYYGFERVRYWASAGVRRTSVATDLWTPFVSRHYIEYCWSLTPEERAVEAAHWRLLSELDPRLRDHRFDHPWRPQRPALVPLMIGRDVARAAVRRALTRGAPPAGATPPFGLRWVESGLGPLRELVAGVPDADVWRFIDRERLQALLDGPGDARAPVAEGLCRALTVLWWLHGRDVPQAGPGR